MNTRNLRVRFGTIAAAAGLLLVGSVTGATAGSLITGKQIKDGTVTTKDIKDRSLRGTDLANGTVGLNNLAPAIVAKLGTVPRGTVRDLSIHDYGDVFAAGEPALLQGSCPTGKVVVSAAAWWEETDQAVQLVYPGTSGMPVRVDAYGAAQPVDSDLTLSVICGRTS